MVKVTLKSISGFENEYEVSDNCQVRSRNRMTANARGQIRLIKSKILNLKRDADNREYVILRKGSRTKKCYIQDIIADAFPQVAG